MDIKPKFQSNTIKMSSPIQKVVPKSKIVKDPEKLIPNGIYKVIKWEVLTQRINIIVSILIFLVSLIIIILYVVVYKNAWATFILPIFILLISLYKLYSSTIEHKHLKKEIEKYREDLKLNLTSQPPFIIRIYRNTFIKQVRHNWVTFFLVFNGGIFTLMLWWLKDFSWWIFEFKKWVRQLFWNPDVMTILFSIGLITIFAIHIFFVIKRKKRIFEIETYAGEVLIPSNEIDELKVRLNKAYRRLFIIYIMIILIIPILMRLVLRFFKKK